MALRKELGMPHDITSKDQETLMSVVVTTHMLEKKADRVFEPYGLSLPQFNILMLLRYQATAEGADQQSLGRMLVVNRSNITGLLDRMEKAGFVRRVSEPLDRRIKRVQLTGKGYKVLSKTEPIYMRHVKEVLSAVSSQERSHLCNALAKMREKINAPK